MRRAAVAVLVCFLCSLTVGGQNRPASTRTEIVPGVHLFTTAPYGDVGLDGNSIAVLSRDGVLVFDTNGTPAAAAAVLAEIRKLTDKPVRYIVTSHWHWDHWYGTEAYVAAFPDVSIVTHEKNRQMMAGPAVEFNRPGMERQMPAYLAGLAKRAETDDSLKPLLETDRWFYEQKQNARLVLPNVTFSNRMA